MRSLWGSELGGLVKFRFSEPKCLLTWEQFGILYWDKQLNWQWDKSFYSLGDINANKGRQEDKWIETDKSFASNESTSVFFRFPDENTEIWWNKGFWIGSYSFQNKFLRSWFSSPQLPTHTTPPSFFSCWETLPIILSWIGSSWISPFSSLLSNYFPLPIFVLVSRIWPGISGKMWVWS